MKNILYISFILFLVFSCSKKQALINKDKSSEEKTSNSKNLNKDKVIKNGGPGFEKIAESLGYKTNVGVDYGNKNAVKGGTLTLSQSYPLNVLRPFGPGSNDLSVATIMWLIYTDSGMDFNTQTNKFQRDIFDYWKFSKDNKTAWFRINPAVSFSDGTPFRADDLLAIYKLRMDDGLGDPMSKNAFKKYKITKISDYIVKVEIEKKDWKAWIDFHSFILPAKYLSKMDARTYLKKYSKDFMPSIGPYTFDKEKSKSNELIVLKKNPNWWGYVYPENKNKYNFDYIQYKIVTEPTLEKEMFKKGDLDYFVASPNDWYGALKKQGSDFDPIKRNLIVKRVLFNAAPKSRNVFVFNLKKKPFDNLKVRKAIAIGFNKDIMIEKLYHNDPVKYFSENPLSKWSSPNVKNYYKYDPQKAAELLDEAGYNIKDEDGIRKNDKGERLEFEVEYYKSSTNPQIHIQFQQDMKAIGIKVNLAETDFTHVINLVDKRSFALIRLGFTGDLFPVPQLILKSDLADKENSDNVWSFKNDDVDALIEKYQSETDPNKRYDYIHKIDDIVESQFLSMHLWTNPYTARFVYWNKFVTSSDYIGGPGVTTYWYVDPKKEEMLEKAKKDTSIVLDEGDLVIDKFHMKPDDFEIKTY